MPHHDEAPAALRREPRKRPAKKNERSDERATASDRDDSVERAPRKRLRVASASSATPAPTQNPTIPHAVSTPPPARSARVGVKKPRWPYAQRCTLLDIHARYPHWSLAQKTEMLNKISAICEWPPRDASKCRQQLPRDSNYKWSLAQLMCLYDAIQRHTSEDGTVAHTAVFKDYQEQEKLHKWPIKRNKKRVSEQVRQMRLRNWTPETHGRATTRTRSTVAEDAWHPVEDAVLLKYCELPRSELSRAVVELNALGLSSCPRELHGTRRRVHWLAERSKTTAAKVGRRREAESSEEDQSGMMGEAANVRQTREDGGLDGISAASAAAESAEDLNADGAIAQVDDEEVSASPIMVHKPTEAAAQNKDHTGQNPASLDGDGSGKDDSCMVNEGSGMAQSEPSTRDDIAHTPDTYDPQNVQSVSCNDNRDSCEQSSYDNGQALESVLLTEECHMSRAGESEPEQGQVGYSGGGDNDETQRDEASYESSMVEVFSQAETDAGFDHDLAVETEQADPPRVESPSAQIIAATALLNLRLQVADSSVVAPATSDYAHISHELLLGDAGRGDGATREALRRRYGSRERSRMCTQLVREY